MERLNDAIRYFAIRIFAPLFLSCVCARPKKNGFQNVSQKLRNFDIFVGNFVMRLWSYYSMGFTVINNIGLLFFRNIFANNFPTYEMRTALNYSNYIVSFIVTPWKTFIDWFKVFLTKINAAFIFVIIITWTTSVFIALTTLEIVNNMNKKMKRNPIMDISSQRNKSGWHVKLLLLRIWAPIDNREKRLMKKFHFKGFIYSSLD